MLSGNVWKTAHAARSQSHSPAHQVYSYTYITITERKATHGTIILMRENGEIIIAKQISVLIRARTTDPPHSSSKGPRQQSIEKKSQVPLSDHVINRCCKGQLFLWPTANERIMCLTQRQTKYPMDSRGSTKIPKFKVPAYTEIRQCRTLPTHKCCFLSNDV